MGVYKPNPAGFDRLANGPQVREHMHTIGEFWAKELRATAPRGRTHRYVNSIEVHNVTLTINGRARASVEILANVDYAAKLEVGTVLITNPPRPLGKLLDRIRAADPKPRT